MVERRGKERRQDSHLSDGRSDRTRTRVGRTITKKIGDFFCHVGMGDRTEAEEKELLKETYPGR